jgi:hypothetical protein
MKENQIHIRNKRLPFWNTYEYTPIFANTIRLLRFRTSPDYLMPINIELVEVSLINPPKYDALSYRWDSLHGSRKIIYNGKILLVSKNCKSALRRLHEEDRYLWVDAICNNQHDIDERKRQVSLMPQIYSNAQCALVWL